MIVIFKGTWYHDTLSLELYDIVAEKMPASLQRKKKIKKVTNVRGASKILLAALKLIQIHRYKYASYEPASELGDGKVGCFLGAREISELVLN